MVKSEKNRHKTQKQTTLNIYFLKIRKSSLESFFFLIERIKIILDNITSYFNFKRIFIVLRL